MKQQKIVLDTNCLLMAISSRSIYNTIWNAFLDEKYVLCVSNEIINEYEEVIGRNVNPRLAEMVILTMLKRRNVERVQPTYRFNLIKSDPDDNKFVDCALVANARFIVTEDHHFDILRQTTFPSVAIIDIDGFLEEIKQMYQ